jgi:hypothetical protein
MPLFLFFVNKPWTIIPYLLGIILFLGVNALNLEFFPFPFIFLSFCFTLWYPLVLVYYFVLRDGDQEILGIKISQLRKLFLNTIWVLVLANVAAGILLVYFDSSFGSMFLILGFTVFSLIIFQSIIEAKLASEALKRNASLKELKFDDLYIEVRQLILTKVIQNDY